jgi:hypothetical protein
MKYKALKSWGGAAARAMDLTAGKKRRNNKEIGLQTNEGR